jgi:hypothetical protein
MSDWLLPLIFLAIWFVLQLVVFPKLGIST